MSSPGWPPHVNPVGFTELGRLGYDSAGRLYWDGQLVITNRFLPLSRWEKVWGIVAALALVLGGIGEFAHGWTSYNEWACEMKWRWAVCLPDRIASNKVAAKVMIAPLPAIKKPD